MSALSIQVPFPVFQGRDGQPLKNGYIWIGEPNLNPQTNPVVAYYDAALTIVAPQPLRTLNGYVSRAGTPAQIYVDAVNFSILVQDSTGSMVYNFPKGTGISPDASGIQYTPAGTGAVATTVQAKLRESVSVKDFGAVGDGVTDDTVAIQAALNVTGTVFIQPGTYKISSSLVVKNYTHLIGAGQYNTFLQYTGTGDAIQINNPINSSTASYITLEHFAVNYIGTPAAGKACIADTGSTFLHINHVSTYGGKYGLILDQTEVSFVTKCTFNYSVVANLWITNGADRSVGALPLFTNRITIKDNNFNQATGVTGTYCVVDDGGVCHTYADNNFNGGGTWMRIAAPNVLTISGNEFEVAFDSHPIWFVTTTSVLGTTVFGTGVVILANEFVPSTNQQCVVFTGSAGNFGNVVSIANAWSNNSTFARYLGLANVTQFITEGDASTGTLADSYVWGDYSASSTIVGWSAFTAKTINTRKSNDLVLVSVAIQGTSNATGVTFTLPYPAVLGTQYVPLSVCYDNGVPTTGGYATINGSTVTCFPTSAGGNWTAANNKYVFGSFTYKAAN
jgi:hypothetical protein